MEEIPAPSFGERLTVFLCRNYFFPQHRSYALLFFLDMRMRDRVLGLRMRKTKIFVFQFVN